MSAENGISIQHQIRENSEDVQNFLRDLDNWEKEMKKKEKELKLHQISDDEEVPPIRNVLSRSKKKNKHKKTKDNSSPKNERISSYNYKAWDKFDADSELKKLDDEKKESSESDSSEKEEDMSKQRNQQLALIKKDKGNEFFKKGNYDSAINCYTLGMQLDPENPLLPANRAMALLKKEQFQSAENDCTLCLSLDSTYVKAYLRRGTARKALNNYSLAKSDFLKALELEPENKQALMELDKFNKEPSCEESVKTSSKGMIKSHDSNKIQTESCKHEEASRLKISTVESGNGENVQNKESFTQISATNFQFDEFRELITKEVGLEANELKLEWKDPGDLETHYTELSDHSNKHDKSKAESVDVLNGIAHIITKLEQSLPPVPTTSYHFLTDWKKLAKYPELKYRYLKQFPPEKLPGLFKYSMEAEIFPDILHTLSTSFIENGDDVVSYLKYLALVGRFKTMLLFLTENDQKNLQALSSYVKASGYSSTEVKALLELYNMS